MREVNHRIQKRDEDEEEHDAPVVDRELELPAIDEEKLPDMQFYFVPDIHTYFLLTFCP